jgi:metal-sulfur cluster biosynthetic enzyme
MTDVQLPLPSSADLVDRARKALRTVLDPELGLDIVALGLVYDLRVDGDSLVVDMTLTTPGCPVAELLPAEAAQALHSALPGVEVELNLVWDPPWTPELLTPEASRDLGFSR